MMINECWYSNMMGFKPPISVFDTIFCEDQFWKNAFTTPGQCDLLLQFLLARRLSHALEKCRFSYGRFCLKGGLFNKQNLIFRLWWFAFLSFLEVNIHGLKNEEPKVWDPNNYSRWTVEGLASPEVCQGWWAKYEPNLVPDSHSANPAVSTDTKSENNISKTIKVATNMQICRHGKKWPHKK